MSEATVSKIITTIPATLNRYTATPIRAEIKRRVAAYARVSTDDEEQLSSYENQVSYYTQYIQEHEGWVFAGMFSDEGISGTDTKNRDGFNAMIRAAMEGEIDLIITKSVSRFARNTVDTLTTVRKLKAIGVEVYFEKENIFTLDSKGELLITIMSSLAQEESRSISENVTWGMRKRFAEGKVSLPYKHFLGYRKGADGLPEIVPEEAEIIRLIYRLFMEGKSPSYIARYLSVRDIPSPAGKEIWRAETVKSILTNEKYKGDALLQKTFRMDFLTKKSKINEGEVTQYYVDHSHPAIIDPEMFDAVQIEMKNRSKPGRRNYTPHVFSGQLYCAECGGLYGSNTCHNQVVWRCNNRHRRNTECKSPALRNPAIQEAFVIAINRVIENKYEIIQICQDTMARLCDVSDLDAELARLQTEIGIVASFMTEYINTNSRVALQQADYNHQFREYETRYNALKEEKKALEQKRIAQIAKMNGIKQYIESLRFQHKIVQFSETLFYNTVDRILVNPDGTMRFEFKGSLSVDI